MARARKSTEVRLVLDLDLLRRIRKAKGFLLRQVAEATGIKPPNLVDLEKGRGLLSWPRLRELLRFYGADLFEAHDLLRLRLLPPNLLRDFRRACVRHGTTPAQALEDFLSVFAYQE